MSTHGRLVCLRRFDDLRPGEQFSTHGRTIGEFDLTAFGALTGDCAPQHLDRAFAGDGPFGGRIAHGALVLSYALGLVPIDPERMIALRALRDVKFKQPVQIGDTIHVEASIGECQPVSDEAGLVELVMRVVNDSGQLVARMNIDVLWRRTTP
jgi:oxepin-CoA hydrolase/3-oxo-5,6-dehydrosuberyl-CoA semialdehyde dehydrogenase